MITDDEVKEDAAAADVPPPIEEKKVHELSLPLSLSLARSSFTVIHSNIEQFWKEG